MKIHKRTLFQILRSTFIFAFILAWVFSPVGQYLNFQFQIADREFEVALAPKIEEANAYISKDSVTSAGTTTWIVPAGVTDVLVKVWGAGGGGGAAGDNDTNIHTGGGGGGGGFARAVLDVTPGQTISLRVGDNGALGSATAGTTDCGAGGGGGGFSGVWNGTDAGGTAYLIIAGGGAGGGGGMDDVSETGGGGGAGGGANGSNGLTGQNLSTAWGDFGDGATTNAVGAGGSNSTQGNGVSGAGRQGGTGTNGSGGAGGAPGGGAGSSCAANIGGSGGAGGGAFGGGGGESGTDEGGGGGGGGSGLTAGEGISTAAGTQGANAGTAGAGANDTDGDYSGTVGDGGAGGATVNANGSAGNDGKIVLIWTNKITLSGTLYSDEGRTTVTSGKTIKLFAATSSTSAATSATSNGSGVYTFGGIEGIATGTPIGIWVDADTSFRASAVTVASTTLNNITGVDLYQNRVIIKHESAPSAATSTTLAKLKIYDRSSDSDIQFDVDGNNDLIIYAGIALYIAPGTHLDTSTEANSGDEIFIHGGVGNDGRQALKFAHGPHPSNPATNVGATLTLGGNLTVGGSWFASSSESIFNHNGKTVTFSATSTGQSIYASSTPFYNVTFDGYNNTFGGGSGGGWIFGESASSTGAFTITDGTVTAPSLISILGNFTNNGTYTSGTGTTTFMGTTTQSISGTLTGSSGFSNVEIQSTANWKYRKKITLKQASSTLTDFPVLISLSDTDLAAHAQPDGDDIFFTSSDGLTRIPHEIEQYSSTTRVSIRINSSTDDAEENISNINEGCIQTTSTDLEFVLVDQADTCGNSYDQIIGMRFQSLSIPQGANIHRAFIQFTTDETGSGATRLRIHGESTNDASTFSTTARNISSRSKTTAFVDWNNVESWLQLRASTTAQRTPDLTPIVQEIVDRSGWSAGNDMAFLVTGSGQRIAEAYDVSASGAPLLWIEYSTTNTGGLSAWVKIPTLSSSATTDIYMYYGNTSTSSEETPSAVWDSNYKGVFHLTEDNTIRGCALDQRMCDSTSNKKHGIARGQITTRDQVTAKIGEGYHIDGETTQYDDLATSSAGVFASSGYSVSIWAKAAAQSDLRLYSEGGQTSANQVFGIGTGNVGTSKIRLYLRDNSNVEKINAESNKTFFDSAWHQMTWTDSNGATALYVDGSRDPTNFNYTFSAFTFTKFSLGSLWWGLRNLGYFIVGTLDEARISNSVRSADWIAIEYDNISATSTFYSSVGAEQQTGLFAPGPKFSNNASSTNFQIITGSTTAPALLSISKNFRNDGGFDANSATTTFNGTSQQYIGGFATGTNAFAGLEITNTASTTFTAAASSTKGLSAVIPGSRLEFRASATSTMQNITIAGTNGNEVYLHSGTDGSTWNFEVPGNRYVSYANVKNSNACYTSGNNISQSNSTDGGGNSCWTFAVTPGTLAISNHASGQESNKFNTSTLDDAELFAFKLTPTIESITVTPIFTIEAFGEIGQSDITNVQLFPDYNAGGSVDTDDGEDPLGGSGTVSLTGNNGTITFSGFSTSTAMNYILRADITDIAQGSSLAINLIKAKITATGDTSSQSITPTGTISQATHSRGDGNSGGGGSAIGGGVQGAGTESGGGGGGGTQTGGGGGGGQEEGGGGGGGGGRSLLPPAWYVPYSLFASVIKQIDLHYIFEWFQ